MRSTLPPPPPPPTSTRPPDRRARRRCAAAILAGAAVVASMVLDAGGWMAVPLLFVLVVPFEKLFPRHEGQRLKRPELGADVVFALANPLLSTIGLVVGAVVGVVSLAWLPGLAVRPLVGLLPGWSVPVAAVALFDLAIYWAHRWSHEVPALRRFHAVHHSARTMDWISGFRNHPVDGLVIAPAVVLLLAAGFGPEATGALAVLQVVVGIFLHANVRWRLRPLQRLVATPEFHHWHHANEPSARNTNYAGLLPVWDQVFGTYRVPADRRPQVYGVDCDLGHGFVGLLWRPVAGLRPGHLLRHPWRSLRSGARCVAGVVRDVRRVTVWRPRRTVARF